MDTDKCQTVLVHLPKDSLIYDFLGEVFRFYKPIHTYLSIIMCIFGTVANFCNIVVLTRRQMRTPVNMILTAMACCDTVVLFSNLVYTTHYQFVAFRHCHPRHWSYEWALFLIAHAHLSLVGHSSSVWLSVMLALVRYMTLRSRGNMGGMQVGLKHSYIAIASTICFVAMVNAPNFLTYKINEMKLDDTCNITDDSLRDAPAYLPGIAEIALARDCLVFRLAFWISGLVFKVIPCCLLSLLVWFLLTILKEVKANRQRLMKTSRHTTTNNNNTPTRNGKMSLVAGDKVTRTGSIKGRSGDRADRTTHMLLAIVFVMLVTEMPQGIMALLSGMFSEEFRLNVYNNVGDLLDLLSLCGACMSFIIYCSMSGQFRNEFRRVFIPKSLNCYSNRSSSIRRPSDAYTTMSYLRPTEFHTTNGNGGSVFASESERSIAVRVMECDKQVRRNSTELTHCTLETGISPTTPFVSKEKDITSSQETVEDETSHLLNKGELKQAIANGTIKEMYHEI